MHIERWSDEAKTVTIHSTLGSATPIPIGNFAWGMIYCPSALGGAATLSFYTSPTEGGTYQAVHDDADAEITQAITASKNYRIPADVLAGNWLKVVADAGSFDAPVGLKT